MIERVAGSIGGRGAGATPPTAPTPEPLWTVYEVARYLCVRPKRVYELGIPSVRLARRTLRYRPTDVEAWLVARSGVA